jgi:hypothetical protein
MAAAVYDGYRMRVLDTGREDVFHVGGVSYFNEGAQLDYINVRLLALPYARAFAKRYGGLVVPSLEPQEARQRLVAERGAQAVERIDRLVDRLAEIAVAG